MSNSSHPFGPVIYSYTRRQAIADGVLVDLTLFRITRQAWKMPLACTSAVWSIIESAVKTGEHDTEGILHDIYTMARLAIASKTNRDATVHFQVIIAAETHAMYLHCGPGDSELPVLTLMMEGED